LNGKKRTKKCMGVFPLLVTADALAPCKSSHRTTASERDGNAVHRIHKNFNSNAIYTAWIKSGHGWWATSSIFGKPRATVADTRKRYAPVGLRNQQDECNAVDAFAVSAMLISRLPRASRSSSAARIEGSSRLGNEPPNSSLNCAKGRTPREEK
jgi:hypothetical protein